MTWPWPQGYPKYCLVVILHSSLATFFVSVLVNLSAEQLAAAEVEALRRQTENESRGLRGRNRAPATGQAALEMHRLGCIGEMAVAVFLHAEDSVFSHKAPVRGSADLPGGLEVKTRPRHTRDLLIQLDDAPGKIFVLVTHQDTTRVVGWARGGDVMLARYVREPVKGRPCYVVPQKALQSPETLRQSISADLSTILGGQDHLWGKNTAIRDAGRIEEDGDGHLVLMLPSAVMEKLGWKPGDMLGFDTTTAPSECIIRKVTVEHAQDDAGPQP